MQTIFDLISAHSSSNDAFSVLSQLLKCSDFDLRLGKKIYLTWIDNVCRHQSLNMRNRSEMVDFAGSLSDDLIRLRLLNLAMDFAKRNSNLVFVESTIFNTLRDSIPLSATRITESDSATMKVLVELLKWLIKQLKTRSNLDISTHRDLIVFSLIKLGVCMHYYPNCEIQPTIVDLLYICDNPSKVRDIFGHSGAGDLWLLFRAFTAKRIPLPPDTCESPMSAASGSLNDFVATRTLSLFSLSRRYFPNRPRGGSEVSFFDMCILARVLIQIGSPQSDLRCVSKYVETNKLNKLEKMVVHFGIVGGLIVGREDEKAVEMIIASVRDPSCQMFTCKVLEYLSVQMMSYPTWSANRRGMIQSLFVTRLNATSNKEFVKQLILDNCPGSVKAFLGQSVAKATVGSDITPTEEQSDANIEQTSVELTDFLDSLKRRRLK